MVWIRRLVLFFCLIFVLGQVGVSISKSGQTDAQGYFEIMVAPGKAITGTLFDCSTGLPVSNAQLTVTYAGTLNRGTPVTVSVAGYNSGVFPVQYLASSWKPSGSYTTYGLGRICLSSAGAGPSATTIIGEDGQFTARFPDGLTVVGYLSECGVGPLAGKEVTITRLVGEGERETFQLSVPGYEPLSVSEYTIVSLFGFTQVNLASICVERELRTVGECCCEEELIVLSQELTELSGYIGRDLSRSLSDVEEVLLTCCPSPLTLEDYCPGPFGQRGGDKFIEFVDLTNELLSLAAEDLPAIQVEDPELQAVLETAGDTLYSVLPELEQLKAWVEDLPAGHLNCLDSYVPEETLDLMYSTIEMAKDPTQHPKLKVSLEAKGLEIARTILAKIKEWVALIPKAGPIIAAGISDIEELLGSSADVSKIAGLLFQLELEKKLDAVIEGLFGVSIPLNATETELQKKLIKIETMEPIIDLLSNLRGIAWTNYEQLKKNQEELKNLEEKTCCLALQLSILAKELGLALYNDEAAFSTQIPVLCKEYVGKKDRCFHGLKTVPADDKEPKKRELDPIKREIRNIEDMVRKLLERGCGQPYDGEAPPCCALTKKIYVYEEGTFTPTGPDDRREIIVTTPAFDLSGWLDLSELRPGDVIRTEIWVRVAGNERLFNIREFQGGPDSRLIHFCELTGDPRGCPELVGSWIKIVISQPQSADNFANPVDIGYQFIVESQK